MQIICNCVPEWPHNKECCEQITLKVSNAEVIDSYKKEMILNSKEMDLIRAQWANGL